MARLVEAAVALKTADTPWVDAGIQAAREQNETTAVDMTPALLPSMETAQQLVDS